MPGVHNGGMNGVVEIRSYSTHDALATLNVFMQAVRVTAALHYSPEQVAAWSGEGVETPTVGQWHQKRSERATLVATIDDEVAGFTDVDIEGYIHMLFVAPSYGRRGVATELLAEAQRRAKAVGADSLTTNASLVLRPLLERIGFTVQAELQPVIRGVELTSFQMVKTLSSQDAQLHEPDDAEHRAEPQAE